MKKLILSVFMFTLMFSGCGSEKKETDVDPDAESKRAAIAILKKLESYTEVGISLNEFSSRLLDINAELNAAIEPIQDPCVSQGSKRHLPSLRRFQNLLDGITQKRKSDCA